MIADYLVCEGAAGAAGAGAVLVWPTVVPGVVLADRLASRGQKNNAPITRTAAAIAAMVPMPIPLREPVVVRVSRSSLIMSLHVASTSNHQVAKCSKKHQGTPNTGSI